ncbi:hypothetical protein K438DRAFT_1779301 [Mycena galopus ATCC 62051]|nr:hypothetical protein K438DRAFT_1779301 [Mycena galopus ATCC 62051]
MHYHLATARADGVNDEGALFGACHLRNKGIVSIHAYLYLWEERKKRGKGEEEGKSGGRTHAVLLMEEDTCLLFRALDDAQRRTTGRVQKLSGANFTLLDFSHAAKSVRKWFHHSSQKVQQYYFLVVEVLPMPKPSTGLGQARLGPERKESSCGPSTLETVCKNIQKPFIGVPHSQLLLSQSLNGWKYTIQWTYSSTLGNGCGFLNQEGMNFLDGQFIDLEQTDDSCMI